MTDDSINTTMPRNVADAWAAAYKEHSGVMYAAASRKLGSGNKKDVEEAVQNAIASVMRSNLPSGITNMRSYLAQAARNCAVDIIDKNATARNNLAKLPVSTSIDPECAVVERVALTVARDLLDRLPDDVAYALRQRWLGGRPAKDVAAELGVKPQYVSQLVNKGLAKLEELSPFISKSTDDSSLSPSTPSPRKDLA